MNIGDIRRSISNFEAAPDVDAGDDEHHRTALRDVTENDTSQIEFEPSLEIDSRPKSVTESQSKLYEQPQGPEQTLRQRDSPLRGQQKLDTAQSFADQHNENEQNSFHEQEIKTDDEISEPRKRRPVHFIRVRLCRSNICIWQRCTVCGIFTRTDAQLRKHQTLIHSLSEGPS